jgi:hypothetical protein
LVILPFATLLSWSVTLTLFGTFGENCPPLRLLEHHNCPLCKDDIITPRKSQLQLNIPAPGLEQADYIVEDQGHTQLMPVELFPRESFEVVVHSHADLAAGMRQQLFNWQWSAHSSENEHHMFSGQSDTLPSSMNAATANSGISVDRRTSGGTGSELGYTRRQDAV